jgi:hypothetical protein
MPRELSSFWTLFAVMSTLNSASLVDAGTSAVI